LRATVYGIPEIVLWKRHRFSFFYLVLEMFLWDFCSMNKTTLSIYEYNDFRRYLADFQKIMVQTDKSFSASNICRQLGMPNTRSYFADVLKGKQVTDTFVDRFARLLRLSIEETRFFRVLVSFNQADTAEQKEWYFEQLISLNRTPKRVVDPQTYLFYKEWHHTAVWAVLDIIDFRNSYTDLAKKLSPQITSKQALESIILLKKLGLIKKNEKGFFKPVDRSLTTGSYVKDALISQYQVKCLDLAKHAIVKDMQEPKNFSTMTLRISKDAYKVLEKRLQSFKAEMRSIAHKDEKTAEVVYQVNIQVFPNSH
jgi:uncharacterized protein (TIGR02147 family)